MAKDTKQATRQKIIEVLNKARSMELQAIHQYMNQHYNLDDMDYGELAANVKLIAIDEMRHAEMFAERRCETDFCRPGFCLQPINGENRGIRHQMDHAAPRVGGRPYGTGRL